MNQYPTIKSFVIDEAARCGVSPAAIYTRMSRGKYNAVGLLVERINSRVIFVLGIKSPENLPPAQRKLQSPEERRKKATESMRRIRMLRLNRKIHVDTTDYVVQSLRMTTMNELETAIEWLKVNAKRITYLRPRRMCGTMMFLAYDRSQSIPYIDGQPRMVDDPTDTRLHDAARALGISFEEPRF